MDLQKISEAQDALGRAFEAFKNANDERIKALEKGGTDPLLLAKVDKANADVTKCQDDLKALQTEMLAAKRQDLDTVDKDAAAHIKAFRASAAARGLAAANIDAAGFKAYVDAMPEYLRKGDKGISDAIRSALHTGSDPEGGYLLAPATEGAIATKVFETSDVRRIATVQPIGTKSLEGIADNDEAGGGWVGEQGSRDETDTPTLGKYEIIAHEVYALPKATLAMLEDAGINVEQWLIGKAADKLSRLENTAFVTGNGVGKPRGFTQYTTVETADATRAWGELEFVKTGTSGGFGSAPNGSDKLISVAHALKRAYRNGAVWAMNRLTVAEVRKLKANSEYIWLPSMVAAQPSTLLGYPVEELEDMAAIGANSLSIAFGNFKVGYTIVDRAGMTVLRDPYTTKGYVKFYVRRRTGGGVVNSEAIKFLKFAA